MCMDLADPVSSGKYNGTSVFTAPVPEPILVSFTVPLVGCTIVANAFVVFTCSTSADSPVTAAPFCCESVCVAMSCGGAHGSDSAENCGDVAVAARRFDISVVVQRQFPMVLFRTIEILQLPLQLS